MKAVFSSEQFIRLSSSVEILHLECSFFKTKHSFHDSVYKSNSYTWDVLSSEQFIHCMLLYDNRNMEMGTYF